MTVKPARARRSPSRARRSTNALPDTPLVDAATRRPAGATTADAELCKADTLDPAKVAGQGRALPARRQRPHRQEPQVKQAGGVGMILYNPTDAQDLGHRHALGPDGARELHRRQARQGRDRRAARSTASLTQGRADPDQQDRVMAAFSSRGPQTRGAGPRRSPTSTAPGVQILAGAADLPAPTTCLRPGHAVPGDPGHVDGLAARRGRGRAAHAGAPDAVAGGAQVRADAHGEPGRAQGGRQDAGRRRSTAARARSTRTRPPTRASSWTRRPTTTCPTWSTSIRRSSPATSRRRARTTSTCASISFSQFVGQGPDDARLQERRLDRDALDGVLRRRSPGIRPTATPGPVLHDQAGPDAADHGPAAAGQTRR